MPTNPIKPPKNPSYRLHGATGQAVVTLNGKDHYLGTHGTPESHAAYDKLIAEWLVKGRQIQSTAKEGPAKFKILELIAAYWQHANEYYVKNGKPTSETWALQVCLRPMNRMYGNTPAAEFGPLKLAAVREAMITAGVCRTSINVHMGRIKRMFRWATAKELIPPGTSQALDTLDGLQYGRSKAVETEPVKPVAMAMVDATLPHVSRQVYAMIKMQLWTGSRPGEVCSMKASEIDMTRPVWCYRPTDHKTAHHGHAREIFIGPQAQRILQPFLSMDGKPLFSPRETVEAQIIAKRAARKIEPTTPSRLARKPKSNPKRPPQDSYDVCSYRRAITRACAIAFPPPVELAPKMITPPGRKTPRLETFKEWKKRLTPQEWAQVQDHRRAHHWHPHQLRHNAATLLRSKYGIDAARVVLGHHSVGVTERYAEKDLDQARQVMAEVG